MARPPVNARLSALLLKASPEIIEPAIVAIRRGDWVLLSGIILITMHPSDLGRIGVQQVVRSGGHDQPEVERVGRFQIEERAGALGTLDLKSLGKRRAWPNGGFGEGGRMGVLY